MITLTREEAQQVLDAFLGIGQRAYDAMSGDAFHECSIAVSRLRARLAQPEPEYRDVVIKGDLWRIEFLPDHAASVVLVKANYEAQSEPKPVVYLRRKEFAFGYEQVDREDHGAIPVYTAPPQREWQGLTEEDFSAIDQSCSTKLQAAASVESILKEKNT